MTDDKKEIYNAARYGIIKRLAEMRKTIDMIESWMFYGEMERAGRGRCAAISEETITLDNEIVTRHPITGEEI